MKLNSVSDEEAFASIKAGIDALPPGVKMFLNSGPCALQHDPDHRRANILSRRFLWLEPRYREYRAGRAVFREVP